MQQESANIPNIPNLSQTNIPSYPDRIRAIDVDALMALSVFFERLNAQLQALSMMGLYTYCVPVLREDGSLERFTDLELYRIFNFEERELNDARE